jgi:hypothetical protein
MDTILTANRMRLTGFLLSFATKKARAVFLRAPK